MTVRHLKAALGLVLIAAVFGLTPASALHAAGHDAEHDAEHSAQDCSVCVLVKHMTIDVAPAPVVADVVVLWFSPVRESDLPTGAPAARPDPRAPPIPFS